MATRDEQQQEREGETVGQARGQRVRLEMIDGNQRQPMHEGDGFGRDEPDDQAADEAGAGGRGHAREVLEPEPSLVHDLTDKAIQALDVSARRDFRDDAAIARMLYKLRESRSARICRRSSTSATAVSWQLVSIPRTILPEAIGRRMLSANRGVPRSGRVNSTTR